MKSRVVGVEITVYDDEGGYPATRVRNAICAAAMVHNLLHRVSMDGCCVQYVGRYHTTPTSHVIDTWLLVLHARWRMWLSAGAHGNTATTTAKKEGPRWIWDLDSFEIPAYDKRTATPRSVSRRPLIPTTVIYMHTSSMEHITWPALFHMELEKGFS